MFLFVFLRLFATWETHKVRAFYDRPPLGLLSTGNHKTNHFSSNSLNRQALTGIDQCSDGGMWMSHVFSIIYTALLFLSPPLRQVSILLHRNQSVICQRLSIHCLIYVSYCGWLHASATAGKEQGGGRERERQGDILQETPKISEEINWFSCQGLIFKMHRR